MIIVCLVLVALVSNVYCIDLATFKFDATEVIVNERDGVARIKIVKDGNSKIQAIVSTRTKHISTTDADVKLGDGLEGDIKFIEGETEKFLEFPLIDDKVVETSGEAKEFSVQIIAVTTLLESPAGAYAISVEPRTAIFYIEDDDGEGQPGNQGGEIDTNLNEKAKLTIACNTKFIKVSFEKQHYPTAELDTAHLKHSSCKPYEEENVVIFKFGLTMCGTDRKYNDQYIEYHNAVYMIVGALHDFPDKNSSFSRRHRVVMPFKCVFNRKGLVTSSVSYNPRSTEIITSAADYGNFTFFMNMYKSKRYEKVESYPVVRGIGQPMYLELKVKSGDARLLLFPDWCRISLYQEHAIGPFHQIMENTCSRDNTLVYDYSMNATQQFSVAALQYKGSLDDLYIHCQATVCRAEDTKSRCAKGCTQNQRKRRGGTSDEISVLLFVGPIHLVRNTNAGESSEIHSSTVQSSPRSDISGGSRVTLVLIVIGLLTFMAVILIVFLIHLSKCRGSNNVYFTVQEKELLELQSAAVS